MPVFNRRALRCEHCNAELPDGIRLSDEQKAHFDELIENEKKQLEQYRSSSGGVDGTVSGGDFGGDC